MTMTMSLPLPGDLNYYQGRRENNSSNDETRHRESIVPDLLQDKPFVSSESSRDAWLGLSEKYRKITNRIFVILSIAADYSYSPSANLCEKFLLGIELDGLLQRFTNSLNLENEFQAKFHKYMCECFWNVLCDEIWTEVERNYFIVFYDVLNKPIYHAHQFALPVLNEVMKQQFFMGYRHEQKININFVKFLLEKGALIDAETSFTDIHGKSLESSTVSAKMIHYLNDPDLKNFFSQRQSTEVSYPRTFPIDWD